MPHIRFVDRADAETAPVLAVYATDANLRPFFTAPVDAKGSFQLPEDALGLLIGPSVGRGGCACGEESSRARD